jgi:hypothetical protein
MTAAPVSFAEYAAAQEARENIALAVLGHTYALCEALRDNYIRCAIAGHKRSINDAADTASNEEYSKSSSFHYHVACIQDLRNGKCPVEFIVETGRKYHKIIFVDGGGHRSVHAFVDKKTGEVYKSASWKTPAKGVRYDLRIIEQREWLLENADWAGGYLYAR